MSESLRYFVGKECVITVAGANIQRLTGVVTAVEGNWMTMQDKGNTALMLNADFIVYIGEKKAKKR